MRITTGIKKGHTIKVPQGTVRPTKDMVRQAIFSILDEFVQNSLVVDLFAGSGSLGLEALSRGAQHCDFVESERKAHQTIEENITRFNLWEKAETYEMEVFDFISHVAGEGTYDLIFADPPYGYERIAKLLHKVTPILRPGGVLVLEHDKKTKVDLNTSSDLDLVDQRTYGITTVSFFKPQS